MSLFWTSEKSERDAEQFVNVHRQDQIVYSAAVVAVCGFIALVGILVYFGKLVLVGW